LGEALARCGATPGDSVFKEAKASVEKSVKPNQSSLRQVLMAGVNPCFQRLIQNRSEAD
jgi:hypothetical protein